MTEVTTKLISGVTAVNKEQLTGTVATISCTVTGLTKALNNVKWTKEDDSAITSGSDGYTVVDGSLNGNSQTTTLTVAKEKNNVDTTYSCVITSTEHAVTDKKTAVNLNVFSKCLICGNWILLVFLILDLFFVKLDRRLGSQQSRYIMFLVIA